MTGKRKNTILSRRRLRRQFKTSDAKQDSMSARGRKYGQGQSR